MFERFTERARQVVVLGQDEARALKHNYIGTEHILLGLLREERGLAARVLGESGITIEQVRQRTVEIVGRGEEVKADQLPFTPRSKKVLELGLREALSLGHNYVGTEHVLLGLMRENEGVAALILRDLGLEEKTVRELIVRHLRREPQSSTTDFSYEKTLREVRASISRLQLLAQSLEELIAKQEEEK